PAAVDALLARAKAYRPLAVYLIAEIRKTVPAAVITPHDAYLVFNNGKADFALLAVSARDVRLGLARAPAAPGPVLEAARFPNLRGAPPMAAMAVLTDARQVTPALMAAVAEATAAP